jgi:hypothetical protein
VEDLRFLPPAVSFQLLKQFFAFPWSKKAIGLDPMLTSVEIVITALESV